MNRPISPKLIFLDLFIALTLIFDIAALLIGSGLIFVSYRIGSLQNLTGLGMSGSRVYTDTGQQPGPYISIVIVIILLAIFLMSFLFVRYLNQKRNNEVIL